MFNSEKIEKLEKELESQKLAIYKADNAIYFLKRQVEALLRRNLPFKQKDYVIVSDIVVYDGHYSSSEPVVVKGFIEAIEFQDASVIYHVVHPYGISRITNESQMKLLNCKGSKK